MYVLAGKGEMLDFSHVKIHQEVFEMLNAFKSSDNFVLHLLLVFCFSSFDSWQQKVLPQLLLQIYQLFCPDRFSGLPIPFGNQPI